MLLGGNILWRGKAYARTTARAPLKCASRRPFEKGPIVQDVRPSTSTQTRQVDSAIQAPCAVSSPPEPLPLCELPIDKIILDVCMGHHKKIVHRPQALTDKFLYQL